MNQNTDETDYSDTKKQYQTKTQIELNKNQIENIEPYEDNLESWNDIDEEDLL